MQSKGERFMKKLLSALIVVLTLTLSLCSLFVLFAHNTSNFTEQVESEIKIFVEFSKEATQEQIAAAIDLMKSQEHVADIIHKTVGALEY